MDDASGVAHVHTRSWQVAYEHVFPTERPAGVLMGEILARLRTDGFREAVLGHRGQPRTRRYYERAGWQFDDGAKEEPVLDIPVRQVRYRIGLDGVG